MKQLSIETAFLNYDESADVVASAKRLHSVADFAKSLQKLPFDKAYDLMRLTASHMVGKDETRQAVEKFRELDALLAARSQENPGEPTDLLAGCRQVLVALLIEAGEDEEALVQAASLLTLLAQDPKRKDEPFMEILGCMLYDIAYIHNQRGQYKQAERELEKSMKLFEKLAKINPTRYATAHILVQNSSTRVYRSRVKQVNMLAHNQVATSTYLEMMNKGVEGAADRLIESLAEEGRTLAKMGRYREAVQYFSRALKYLTKIEPEFTERQLELSIDLGEALLNVKVSREKGIHLLNTMLHKATKLNAEEQHRRIVDILLNAKNRRLDMLRIWHKVFPR